MRELIDIGKRVYTISRPKEFKRMIVFLFRSMLNHCNIMNLLEFFKQSNNRKKILNHIPFFIEQATRSFFYRKSTCSERCKIIKNHFFFFF